MEYTFKPIITDDSFVTILEAYSGIKGHDVMVYLASVDDIINGGWEYLLHSNKTIGPVGTVSTRDFLELVDLFGKRITLRISPVVIYEDGTIEMTASDEAFEAEIIKK